MQDKKPHTQVKLDKRAAALRDNLRKRKELAKEKKAKEKATPDDNTA